MNTQPTSSPFNVDNFKSIYQTFDSKMLSHLPSLYSEDIVFKDPIHQLQGLDALRRYFANFLSPEMNCSFVFSNQLISNEQAFLQWKMHYRHPRLENGNSLTLNGGTLIKFNSHIYYHEDLYDMGAMLYQHIPILGWAVKKINAHVASSS